MEKREHASIDIEKLADTLNGKLRTLHPLSRKCCIYRISQRIRQLNESACSPRAVSIGPFHHGIEELKAMEEQKLAFLRDFLHRTEKSIMDFLLYVKDKEVELRECYAETISIESNEFVEMILLDAAFVIEFLLKCNRISSGGQSAYISSSIFFDLWPDIWKLENQLPMFMLKGLFELAMPMKGMPDELSLFKLIRNLKMDMVGCCLLKIEENFLEDCFSEGKHLLDWLRLCLQPPELHSQNEFKTATTPAITELEQAGVKFKVGSSKYFFDITFKNGILEIPELLIVADTEILFMNLLAYEQLNCSTRYSNDFIVLMNRLVRTRKDEEILIQNGVIEDYIWGKGGGTAVFQKLGQESDTKTDSFYYTDLVNQLNAYCGTPWNKWRAALKQNHFNTPWASISVIAAVILLVLTFIQAVCSVIAL
ncbi:putative UPF0481 protein At3g02645 [Pistacia vera]|uniref:putative UPF0481 protein At3g02645 n=1 Tax=Pistacia vera TaxID=55513 RepID=UPI001263DB87|nr:putative UPF0481 protein At3g02645 [Pistacia vera]XP_031271211.1 putative UPF0481 protein At3g02645 [Pistacia vera]XP_031271213.1 putative UPF0481 protein At3g02645 [Pistacia vera]XP_031271214.1 putative UPF0481 protein At3g02645 [Pistacia vera]XP_031271215.1 putative UPF0481 protein At3g02645 [Pistacia vera]